MSYLTLIVIVSLFCNTVFNIVIGTGRTSLGRRETQTNFPEDPNDRKAKRDYVLLSEEKEISEQGPEGERKEEEEDPGARDFSKFRKVYLGILGNFVSWRVFMTFGDPVISKVGSPIAVVGILKMTKQSGQE